ncbi:cytidylate kinase family protein [Geoalkalibacter halelectricus]|uniref:Cytidylate kinase family protein n=1 Tax=Geoalkalibacter halelectricus TaxID=2847045 RepID=A0ABY5ZP91_9BACT|nr:cytidylate kinase family protein [Geoalkalibacter halelectricus]MDO3379214.1 cytidylate kinase family protein [Geoalkalibacter halelectricus]UWZ80972.1 cytidylate kinase family protein [Geoalkalibacter halelectricus]
MAIITISREMGSGGIPIAHKAAEKLGYTLIDGESIIKAAVGSGMSPEAIEKADEKPPAFIESEDQEIEADLHKIELIILEAALKGNVIIYGRGGQDLLRDVGSVFRVRIIAPFELRVERWAEREWLDPDLARKLVRRSDQQRAGFIKYYFDRDWEDPLGYDLVINTERLTEETAVKLICDGVRDEHLKEQQASKKKILNGLILRKRVEIGLLTAPGVEDVNVEVQVTDGVITLQGTAHSEAERREMEKIAGSCPGAKDVINRLRVIEYRSLPDEH